MTAGEIGFEYPARFSVDKESGMVLVTFRDLPEALTEGGDMADAFEQARDCLNEAIAGRIDDGEEIPVPGKARRREILVPLGPLVAAKAALYLAIEFEGSSKIALARMLKIDEKEVRRLLDPRHPSKVERISTALAALGHHLTVGMKSGVAR